ncbi:flavodoxin family protein [candidate division WOR-3 bacterium]|nr:flavodoxin family protein [candidate division WOR-3 bacterium]
MTARAKILIVYDSFFGNTEKVARAMRDGLATEGDASVCRVNDVKPEQLAGLDVLLVGSPTRAFRPTKATMDLLNALPGSGLKGVRVAAFDTRIAPEDVKPRLLRWMVKLFGYASEPISKRLVKKGGELALTPEGFCVMDSEGPLKDGELERAAAWARSAMK